MDRTILFQIFAAFLFLYNFPTTCLSRTSPNITTDQSALLALKSSLTLPPDHILVTNWTTTTPSSVCYWVGITCGKLHRRVQALDLPNMGLIGNIPPHLGNLSFLVHLDIGNNSFYGDLPKELANLRRLQHIDVLLNHFSGQIPQWFGAIPKLVYLDVSNNSFSGSLPHDFGNLQSLKALYMEFNQFTGSIPWTIFNLSSLEGLGFTGNSLSGNLPANMCNHLPNLKDLYLSGNELEGQFPPGLQECSKLQILSLSVNKFTGRIPSEIGNLTMLKELYLGKNSLEGEIPREFAKLVNLEQLELDTKITSDNLGLIGSRWISSLSKDYEKRDVESKVVEIKEGMRKLYNWYENRSIEHEAPNVIESSRNKEKKGKRMDFCEAMDSEFLQYMEEETNMVSKLELERYWLESNEDPKNENFDLLTWWSVNCTKYPILS